MFGHAALLRLVLFMSMTMSICMPYRAALFSSQHKNLRYVFWLQPELQQNPENAEKPASRNLGNPSVWEDPKKPAREQKDTEGTARESSSLPDHTNWKQAIRGFRVLGGFRV